MKFALIALLVLFSPAFSFAASISSVQTGAWSSAATWDAGVPKAGDRVTITAGHIVAYDGQSDAVVDGVDIYGTLKFSRSVSTRLKTNDSIIVHGGGFLDMGTESDYIPNNVKVELIFVLPNGKTFTGTDQFGNPHLAPADTGLFVMPSGIWEVHGAPLVRTWSKLAADEAAGSASITMENNLTDWPVNGYMVITQTSNPLQEDSETFKNENEVRRITAVEKVPEGTRLTLDSGLSFAHKGSGKERGEAGLLTRNVLITTDILGTDEGTLESASQAARDGRRFAHTMYMWGSTGNVEYAEFKYMGHDRVLGRYPVHFHQMHNSSLGSIIRGNSVWYSGSRAYVIHDSDGILVEDNVAFNTVASPYFMELTCPQNAITPRCVNTPPPQDNVLVHNLGVMSMPVSAFNSLGGAPSDEAIFWLDQRIYQTLIGNVAVGAHATSGPETLRNGGFQADEGSDVEVSGKPDYFILYGNEAHSNRAAGFLTWCGNCGVRDFLEFHSWRNGMTGFWWSSYVNPIKLYNSRFAENAQQQVLVWSIRTHHQDNEYIGGSKPAWFTDNQTGINIVSYVQPPSPDWPARIIRGIFSNNDIDVSQAHDTSRCDLTKQTIAVTNDQSCNANYMEFINVSFAGSPSLDFGWNQNANTFFRVFGYQGPGGLPQDFVVFRKDQTNPATQAQIPGNLTGGSTFYSSFVDALITPMGSLPLQIAMTLKTITQSGGSGMQAYTFSRSVDMPPAVSLKVDVDGGTVRLRADAVDDNGVTKVELWNDEKLIVTDTAAPFETALDISSSGRRYTYFYAKAYDGYTQTPTAAETVPYVQASYSRIVEIGPENMSSVQSFPSTTTTTTTTLPARSLALLSSPQKITPVVAGGADVIYSYPIIYSGAAQAFSVRRPALINASNIRVNESGTTRGVSVDPLDANNVTWSGDAARQAWLPVDVPAPAILVGRTSLFGSTLYQKEFNISSENSFSNVTATIDFSPQFTYTAWRLYEGAGMADVTQAYNLQVDNANHSVTFSGFSLSTKQFFLEGSSDGTATTTSTTVAAAAQPSAQQTGAQAAGGGAASCGGRVSIVVKNETVDENPQAVVNAAVSTKTVTAGGIGMEILAPASVENAEEFNVTLVLKPAEAITVKVFAEAVFIAGSVQHESHEAAEQSFGAWTRDVSVPGGSEERLTFMMTVPETLCGEFLVYAKE